VGGKSRLAGKIAEYLSREAGDRRRYIEPFIGGGSVFAKVAPLFEQAEAGDASEDIVMMWLAVSDGWLPPEALTENDYKRLMTAPPSALRGFAGFGCSFGGKWFGGFARGGKMGNGEPRNHQSESFRAVKRMAPAFHGRKICQRDYREWQIDADCVVYCDPPYEGTQEYGAVGAFDSAEFWRTAQGWSESGALVLVSEYSAPKGWRPVLSMPHRQSLQHGADGRPETTERVWRFMP